MIIENNDGTETFYRTYGDPTDEALLLLHGLGADHRMWRPQVEPFNAAGYFLIVPDLLGHGQSSSVQTLSLRDWERQIANLLREESIERCIPIGVSMGGVIAQSFAVHHPEKVSYLILSDTFGEMKTLSEKARGFAQLAGLYLCKLLGSQVLARMMVAAYNPPFARKARAYFREVSLQADLDQLILARKAINQVDRLEDLSTIDIPSLVLVGDQFGEWFIAINRKVAEALPESTFVVLEQAMDPSNLVNPADFNQAVLSFLREGGEVTQSYAESFTETHGESI